MCGGRRGACAKTAFNTHGAGARLSDARRAGRSGGEQAHGRGGAKAEAQSARALARAPRAMGATSSRQPGRHARARRSRRRPWPSHGPARQHAALCLGRGSRGVDKLERKLRGGCMRWRADAPCDGQAAPSPAAWSGARSSAISDVRYAIRLSRSCGLERTKLRRPRYPQTHASRGKSGARRCVASSAERPPQRGPGKALFTLRDAATPFCARVRVIGHAGPGLRGEPYGPGREPTGAMSRYDQTGSDGALPSVYVSPLPAEQTDTPSHRAPHREGARRRRPLLAARQWRTAAIPRARCT